MPLSATDTDALLAFDCRESDAVRGGGATAVGVKAMDTVQLPLAGSGLEVLHEPPVTKSVASAPETVMPEKVTAALPVFCTVRGGLAYDVVPRTVSGKPTEDWESARNPTGAAVPEPFRVIWIGLDAVLSAIESVALRAPSAPGVKAITRLHEPLAGMGVVVHVFVESRA